MFQDTNQRLIGTYSGKIILITVNENSISIDDSYLICQEVKVKSISCNKNHETDLEKTYSLLIGDIIKFSKSKILKY